MPISYKTIYWVRNDATFHQKGIEDSGYKILRLRSLDAVERYCEREQYVTVFERKDASRPFWMVETDTGKTE